MFVDGVLNAKTLFIYDISDVSFEGTWKFVWGF